MSKRNAHILFIDNEDSFVFNLVDAYAARGHHVDVYRNDWPIDEALSFVSIERPDLVVLSPGPCGPRDATLCMQLLERLPVNTSVFGVCLGFQCIVEHFGGRVAPTKNLAHGKAATITHDDSQEWNEVQNPFVAGRYHSLAAVDVPNCLNVCATMGDMPMAVRHTDKPVFGVQFHPESVLTPVGDRILENVLRAAQIRLVEGTR